MKRSFSPFIPLLACCMIIALVVITGCTSLGIPGLPKSGQSEAPVGSQRGDAIPTSYTTFPPSNAVPGSDTRSSQNGPGSQTCDATVNFQTDSKNCGECGAECPPNSHCGRGQCACDTGYGVRSNQCVLMSSGPPSASSPDASSPTGTCDASTNFLTDSKNCGKCRAECPDHSSCDKGVCSCDSGYEVRSNQCVKIIIDSDPTIPTSVTTASSGGTCGVRKEGTICKQQAGPDLCVNLNVSNTHCGACFNSCSSTGACIDGRCITTTCPKGEVDALGSCISMDFPKIATINCGGFAQQCPPGNTCWEGVCEPLTCPSPKHICAGYFCCPADTDNPCPGMQMAGEWCGYACRNFQTDAKNCGGCSSKCPKDQICSAGKCNNPECDTASDCMKPTPPHMEWAACTNHQCVLACTSGLGDCNAKISDGCEVNLMTAASNCGSCGFPCSGTCTNGKCDRVFAVITTLRDLPIIPSWKGIWATSLTKPITMNQNQNSVTGTYINSLGTPGKLSGTLSNNDYTLKGTWIEGSSQGPFEFDMTDMNHFKGWWGNSLSDLASKKSANPSGIWNGSR